MSIAFLDTDFIRKTRDIIYCNCSLLDKTLELNHDFYVSEKVLNELPKKDYNDIIRLITMQKIKLCKISDCVNMLYKSFGDLAFNIFLNDLLKIINNMFGENKFYITYFQRLEVYAFGGTTTIKFAEEFENVLKIIPTGNNMGEICTILETIEFIRCKEEHVYSFLSDDNNARACATNVSEDINTYSCHSLFILLKEKGLPQTEAKEYAKKWMELRNNQTVKVIYKGSSKGLSVMAFIKSIYECDYKIKRNGLPELC